MFCVSLLALAFPFSKRLILYLDTWVRLASSPCERPPARRLFFISSANSKLFIVFLQSHNSLEIPVNHLSKSVICTIFLKPLITTHRFGGVWFLTCLLWNSAPLLDNGGTGKARRLASRQSISVLWRQSRHGVVADARQQSCNALSANPVCPFLTMPYQPIFISTGLIR